jgi:hypothetical protein
MPASCALERSLAACGVCSAPLTRATRLQMYRSLAGELARHALQPRSVAG